MVKFTYLLVDFFTILVPFIFSFHPKLQFHKHFKSFLPAALISAAIFIVWDIYFTAIGVWGFNPTYLTGIKVANLPVEEILFFFCIPFSCVFTYHCFNRFFDIGWPKRMVVSVFIILSVTLLLAGFFFLHKYYTASTFISLGALILFLLITDNTRSAVKLMSIYPVLLIPFFIVNGILTGSGLDAPVVWYNNDENLGIRLTTIPFEDIFYGFELLLLNVVFFDYFKDRKMAK